MNDVFISGSINPLMIADHLNQLSKELGVGGHGIFLGQVRNDFIDGQQVKAIEYTTYEDMALSLVKQIKSEIKTKHQLISITVLHSIGIVPVGELCLFVLTASAHRKSAFESCQEAVERIKSELPIWGKEMFDNDSFAWKKNT